MKLHAAASFLSVGILDVSLRDIRSRDNRAERQSFPAMADAVELGRRTRHNNKRPHAIQKLRTKHGIKQGAKRSFGNDSTGDPELEATSNKGVAHGNARAKHKRIPPQQCDPVVVGVGTVKGTTNDSLLCPEGSRCIPSKQSDAGGLCVKAVGHTTPALSKVSPVGAGENTPHTLADTGHRAVQVTDYTDDFGVYFFNSVCSPDGAYYGRCYNCPDDPSFNITQDPLLLSCQGDGNCIESQTFQFIPVEGYDPYTYESYSYVGVYGPFPVYNCSLADRVYQQLCVDLNEANVTCACPGGDFDPNVDVGLITCANSEEPCVQLVAEFLGNSTVEAMYEYSGGACSIIQEYCVDIGCNCDDLDLSDGYDRLNGTISCPYASGCFKYDIKINNGESEYPVFFSLPNVTCEIPLPDLCYLAVYYGCDCTDPDPLTGTQNGTCTGYCTESSFTIDQDVATVADFRYCSYTEFGELCMYDTTRTSIQCPTLNGQECQCNPIDCGPMEYVPYFIRSFEFDCGSGLAGNTCDDSFINNFVTCGVETVYSYCDPYGSYFSDLECDCSQMSRDGNGPYNGYSFPLDGSMECESSFGRTLSVEFSGNYTFKRSECISKYVGYEPSELCLTLPFPVDGGCSLAADGQSCADCERIICPFESVDFYGTGGVCPTSGGPSVFTSTCAYYGISYVSGMPSYRPPVTQPLPPTLAPSSAGTSSPSLSTKADSDPGTSTATASPSQALPDEVVGATEAPSNANEPGETEAPSSAAVDRGLTDAPTSAAAMKASSWMPVCAIGVGIVTSLPSLLTA